MSSLSAPGSSPSESSQAMINKLVGFDTTSAKSNLELIGYIRDYLEELGIRPQLVFNGEHNKANLYATIGPEGKAGVMLSGHTDVVPVTGQNWDSDPFVVKEKKGALFGRGTADMKSFIAVALAYLPNVLAANLQTPIHLAFSYDEEIGCVGVRRLLHIMEGMPVKPAMCIVGEPTSMSVVNAHKGKLAQRVQVRGLEAHSSLPHTGVNAIDYAARLIVYVNDMARKLAQNGPFEQGYAVKYTTLHTGTVQGGTMLNIVPEACSFDFEIRNLPSQDPKPLLNAVVAYARETLEPEMKAVDDRCGFEFEHLSAYPGMFTPANEDVVGFVQGLIGSERLKKITFGTEGGLFTERLGIPTVVCGPGNIEQAHRPNEFIELSQVSAMEKFMQKLTVALSRASLVMQ